MKRPRITGLQKVVANLNREIRKIKGRTKRGVGRAALMIKAEAQRRTPVDTGNLKGGAYVVLAQDSNNPSAEIGFTASYAPEVHEIPRPHRGSGQWKFLESAMNDKASEALRIIREDVRIK